MIDRLPTWASAKMDEKLDTGIYEKKETGSKSRLRRVFRRVIFED
jgi:hypothetical protein